MSQELSQAQTDKSKLSRDYELCLKMKERLEADN